MALGPYDGSIRDLCLLLKQERNAWLAPWLSELLAEAYQTDLAQLPRDTWIIPIPLHWWRRLERGYNQAEALAQGLARHLDLKLSQPLRRVKPTGHLASKSAAQRMEAVRGMFQARYRSQAERSNDLAG